MTTNREMLVRARDSTVRGWGPASRGTGSSPADDAQTGEPFYHLCTCTPPVAEVCDCVWSTRQATAGSVVEKAKVSRRRDKRARTRHGQGRQPRGQTAPHKGSVRSPAAQTTSTSTSTTTTATPTTDHLDRLTSPSSHPSALPSHAQSSLHDHHARHARVQLRVPSPEQGLCLHLLPALRQTRCVIRLSVFRIRPPTRPRPALDTNSPLPLFNSLTHLVYLTSTSPRIREIMTMDGGLERLVRILRDFCTSPPPPENPVMFYGLSPPGAHPPKLPPTLLPKSFDKHAAYRFSLAFQCIVNIGVRGSEPIRSRVVQAGTLDVVGCILEAWLASKGFPIGPSVAANGMPRETREQRLARRQAQSELRQRDQAMALARALERQISERQAIRIPLELSTRNDDVSREVSALACSVERRPNRPPAQEPMQTEQPAPGGSRAQDTDTSADTSTNATPNGSNTPTGSVVVPGRDRSGTIIARPVWDQPNNNTRRQHRSRLNVPDNSAGPSTSTSAANSRPETETEDDGDVDMDTSRDDNAPSPSPERQQTDTGTIRATHSRRAVGIVSDAAAPAAPPGLDLPSDAHIIINDEGVVPGVGVEDGIVSLETNDDFAMGAPPGAPGALDGPPPTRPVADGHGTAGERTPRAGTTNLPMPMTAPRPGNATFLTPATLAEAVAGRADITPVRQNTIRAGNANNANNAGGTGHHHHHHHREVESGPYRDEDVLLSLQLLAYLSKYPHCRQAFYKPRTSFHPAVASMNFDVRAGSSSHPSSGSSSRTGGSGASSGTSSAGAGRDVNPFMKAFNTATGRGKEKERATPAAVASAPSASSGANTAPTSAATMVSPPRMTNVFALVERFTYRHSSSELESANPPPSLPPEIQYWAGVIMRNACRKDDSRGGIRQCANSECSRFHRVPSYIQPTLRIKCCAENGSASHASSPSVGGAGRRNTAGKSARARRGVRATGSGAAPRSLRRTVSTTITTARSETARGQAGTWAPRAPQGRELEPELEHRWGARKGERRESGSVRRGWRRRS